MDIEERIAAILDRVDNHPKTYQKGEYRVRIQGPFHLQRPERWSVALEPYNDYDAAEGIGVTIREALANLETNIERDLLA